MLRGTLLFALALALLAPGTAGAAGKPGAKTGAAASITPTTATLNGRVDPNKAATTYFFQYGTTSLYGATTAVTAAGAGANPVAVSVPVAGLAPATTYHYRLIAQNSFSITRGEHRTFKTRRQPLGLSLTAAPNPVHAGKPTVLAGQLTGTSNANRGVVLQSNAFPYAGWVNVGNALLTDAAGNFNLPVLAVPVTTRFRALMTQRPEVVSPEVTVGVALRVGTDKKKVARYRHSVTVRFRGSVWPKVPGVSVSIQKLQQGVWVEKARTFAKDAGSTARYRKLVRIHSSGQFRVVALGTGAYVDGAGRTVTVRAPR
ncbi:MAG TPA: hypothetical protein VEY49_00065 [Solirubrobacteraceae bacterium]|nr:hypothetical protein [Solirubrobacteraceae bacterium]